MSCGKLCHDIYCMDDKEHLCHDRGCALNGQVDQLRTELVELATRLRDFAELVRAHFHEWCDELDDGERELYARARAILAQLSGQPEPDNVRQLRELVRKQWTRIHSDHPQWTDGVAKENCPWDECREAREALEKL